MNVDNGIISSDDLVLVTGASGFIGKRVIASLLEHGFRNIRCLVRPFSDVSAIVELTKRHIGSRVEVVRGNLLSPIDCATATKGVTVIYHLAVGAGGKSFPDSFIGAVITTRNLIEASLNQKSLRRFVNVSSFAVYTNRNKSRGQVLDETAEVEPNPEKCGEAYCYAKVRQDDLVLDYGRKRGLPYVILRPGVVYGPGKKEISGRIGLGTFGIFLHLGGSNAIPFTYVDNCADAIVIAGLKPGVEGEVFNVVDDGLPSSRAFLRAYKKHVRSFSSIFVPRPLSYLLCYLWEKGSERSLGQIPPFLNRRAWRAYWKGSRYSNQKLKTVLGWAPRVSITDGMARLFESCAGGQTNA